MGCNGNGRARAGGPLPRRVVSRHDPRGMIPRVFRRTVDILAVLSQAVCLVSLVCWPFPGDPYGFIWRQRWSVANYEGALVINHFLADAPAYQPSSDWGWRVPNVIAYRHFEGHR